MQLTGVESNIWKYFLIQFTNRRNFVPILSIYFLTLPNTHANEIWLYTGIWYAAAMFMQIPSGFIADHWGQKNALIIAKILLILSSIFYLIADSFWIFTIGSICMSLGMNAFATGTSSSFLKGTLEKLGRGDEYRIIASRISGNVSLLSILFMVWLPFFTTLWINIPLYITLGIDIMWLVIAIMLHPVHIKIEKHEQKKLILIIKELRGSWFFPYAIFSSVIAGFLFTDSVYRSPYLIELGYPLVFVGLVMGGSRLVWWMVGRSIKTIEKYISFKIFLITEIFLFPLYYIGASYITNPWVLGIIFSLMVGWFWGRNEVYTDILINHIPDHRYRATALSIKAQIDNVIQVTLSFAIAGIMGISYALGFQILWIVLFISLSLVYFFWIRKNYI